MACNVWLLQEPLLLSHVFVRVNNEEILDECSCASRFNTLQRWLKLPWNIVPLEETGKVQGILELFFRDHVKASSKGTEAVVHLGRADYLLIPRMSRRQKR